MERKNFLILPIIFLLLLAGVFSAYSREISDSEKTAGSERVDVNFKKILEEAKRLYSLGEYEECRDFLDSCNLDDNLAKRRVPKRILARIYKLMALISYAFRDEGYKEEIRDLFSKAVKLDINLEIGDQSEIPFEVIKIFTDVKDNYLLKFQRTTKRKSIGIYCALIMELSIFEDISIIQPGLHFSYNLNDFWALAIDIRFPLKVPIWDSIRGQIGMIWFPTFRVEKLSPGMSVYYLFALDELSRYTHSISIGGQTEFILRSGLGFSASAEIFRIDLLLGHPPSEESLGEYRSLTIFSDLLRFVFTNINICIFYNF